MELTVTPCIHCRISCKIDMIDKDKETFFRKINNAGVDIVSAHYSDGHLHVDFSDSNVGVGKIASDILAEIGFLFHKNNDRWEKIGC